MTDLNNLLINIEENIDNDTNLLAKVLRGLMYDMNIGPLQMSQLLTRWLDNPRNRIPKSGNTRSNKRGNLIKEIAKPKITWTVFEKAIILFAPASYTVSVSMTMQDGNVYSRDIKVNLNNPEEYNRLLQSTNVQETFEPRPINISAITIPQPTQPVEISPEAARQLEIAKQDTQSVTANSYSSEVPAYAKEWLVRF